MRINKILRIAILPIVLFTVVAFTNLPSQKDKGKSEQGQSSDKDRGQESKKNKSNSAEHKNQDNNKNQVKSQSDRGNKSDHRNKNEDQGNSDKMNGNRNVDHYKMSRGNGNSHKMNGKRNVSINWGLSDFEGRKRPKDQKKVTVCHNPSEGDNNNGVTINISENALKAHLNHGDKMGTCNIDYSDRWSESYIKSRENVYNTYEQTWETMSYSEALLRLAADKLLGIKSNLATNRATLSASEIQRREALIFDLQNNMNALDNQVGVTRQKLDSDVNIIITL